MSTVKVDTIQTTGGVSEIAIDKLKGVSAASSISVVGEGGTTTTNLQQGLAKVWCNHTFDVTIQDSFNVSGVTDEGTGSYDTDFTNAMVNNDYSALCGAFGTSQQSFGVLRTAVTTSYRCNLYDENGSADDRDLANVGFGDLA